MEISDFKNKYLGERCFIIGNGPSLNKTNLKCLKNETTFGTNGIFLNYKSMGYMPTFYIVADMHYVKVHVKDIDSINGTIKLFPRTYKKYFPHNNDKIIYLNITDTPHKSRPNFSIDADKYIKACYTTTYLNMQLAYYMGIRKVYLIGVDHDWGDEIAQHPKNTSPHNGIINPKNIGYFHPDYILKDELWMIPYFKGIEAGYSFAKKFYEEHNGIIYNATVGGKLEIFKRKSLEEIMR